VRRVKFLAASWLNERDRACEAERLDEQRRTVKEARHTPHFRRETAV